MKRDERKHRRTSWNTKAKHICHICACADWLKPPTERNNTSWTTNQNAIYSTQETHLKQMTQKGYQSFKLQ